MAQSRRSRFRDPLTSLPRHKKRSASDLEPDDRGILDELNRRRDASDEQLKADRKARVAAERERWGITDCPTPEWLLWKARRTLLDVLHLRVASLLQQQQKQRKVQKVPLPDPDGWVELDALQEGPTGRPKKYADRELINRARKEGVPGHPVASFRAALAYHLLLEKGTSPDRAKSQALAGPPRVSLDERKRVLALERLAQHLNKKPLEKSTD